MRTLVGMTVVSILILWQSACVAAGKETVDLKAVAAAGAKTQSKFESQPVSWSVANTLQSGAIIHVSVLRSADKARTEVAIENGGKRANLLDVISRDGLWYVTDRSGSRKCRPYEAVVDTPMIYLALGRSQPVFISSPEQLADSELVKVSGDVATYRRPLMQGQLALLKATVEQMESVAKETGRPLTNEQLAQLKFTKELIAHGVSSRIDLTTGRLVEFGTQKLRTQVTNFQFLPQVADEEFDVSGENWIDYSDDPMEGNLNDLTMINFQPGIEPGAKNHDTEGMLLDVKTGRFRRIPFPYGSVIPGCFLEGRRAIMVSGLDFETGSLRPFTIDLKTGQCEPLDDPLLNEGVTMWGDLSPDKKLLAVSHLNPAAGILKSQICIVDLATHKATPLGEPLDTAKSSWTADGQHLVLVARSYKDLNSPTISTIAKLSMDGKLIKLRLGNSPILMADRRTILFEDDETDLWHTCDLEGENVQLYANGLKGYGFPAPGPDGKHLLMMRFSPGKLPEPVVLEIGKSEGRVITRAKGLWAMPQWR